MSHDELGPAPLSEPAPPVPYASPVPYGTTAAFSPQGYYPPQGYPPQGYYPPPRQGPPVLAIVGLLLAFVVPPIGVIVSIVALVRARRGGNGRGLAIGGIVAGTITTLLGAAAVVAVIVQTQDARDAFSAHQRLEDALVEGDCSAYLAVSTPGFRAQLGALTCEDFAAFIAPVAGEAVDFSGVPVTAVEVHGDTATVSTLEQLGVEPNGDPILQAFDYTLVRQDDTWLVDRFELGD